MTPFCKYSLLWWLFQVWFPDYHQQHLELPRNAHHWPTLISVGPAPQVLMSALGKSPLEESHG